jgi:hypothetical protein
MGVNWKKVKKSYKTVIPQKDEALQGMVAWEQSLVRFQGKSLDSCIGETVVRALMFLKDLEDDNIYKEMIRTANSFRDSDLKKIQKAVKNPGSFILNKIYQVILLRRKIQRGPQEVYYSDEEAGIEGIIPYFNPGDFKRLKNEVNEILQGAKVLEPVRSPEGTTFKKVPNKVKKISNARKIIKIRRKGK